MQITSDTSDAVNINAGCENRLRIHLHVNIV